MLLMYESLFQPRWNQATNPVCNLIRYHDMTHYLNSQTSWVGLKMICNCIVSSSHHRTSLLDLIIITITQHSNSGCFPVLQEGVNTWVISTRCPALCSLYVRQRCLIVSHLIWPRQPGDVSWSVSDSQLSGLRPLPGPGQVSSNNTRNQSLAARREGAVSRQTSPVHPH